MLSNSTASQAHFKHFFWVPPALLLISAALSKSFFPLPFLSELANYGFNLSPLSEAALALLLPALEMSLGALLLFRRSTGSAVAALILLSAFTLVIIFALPAGYLHSCGCLGPEKLEPELALAKNGLALILLLIGFLPWRRTLKVGNPWGALAVILGGNWLGTQTLVLYALVGLIAALIGRRSLILYLAGLLLGVALHLLGFPALSLIAAALVLFLLSSDSSQVSSITPLVMGSIILLLTIFRFLYASAPSAEPLLLTENRPWPHEISRAFPDSLNAAPGRLVIFLRPDCDDCRDWLATAIALSRPPGLPSLVGIIPRAGQSPEEYRRLENLPFEIYQIAPQIFAQTARRTPLLVYVEADTVQHIFPEGTIPTAGELKNWIRDESR